MRFIWENITIIRYCYYLKSWINWSSTNWSLLIDPINWSKSLLAHPHLSSSHNSWGLYLEFFPSMLVVHFPSCFLVLGGQEDDQAFLAACLDHAHLSFDTNVNIDQLKILQKRWMCHRLIYTNGSRTQHEHWLDHCNCMNICKHISCQKL